MIIDLLIFVIHGNVCAGCVRRCWRWLLLLQQKNTGKSETRIPSSHTSNSLVSICLLSFINLTPLFLELGIHVSILVALERMESMKWMDGWMDVCVQVCEMDG